MDSDRSTTIAKWTLFFCPNPRLPCSTGTRDTRMAAASSKSIFHLRGSMMRLATGWGGRLFSAPFSQTHHLMRTKNLAVLPRTAILPGQREGIRTSVNRMSQRVLRRYHLWICAVTGMRMSRAAAVRAGLTALGVTLTLITAECLPLCMLFLSSTLLIAQPWRK